MPKRFLTTPSIRGPKVTPIKKKRPKLAPARGRRVSALAKAGPGKKFGKRISGTARRR